ncbi:MAG: [Lentisphaeria bacterium]|nr:[FeFe] hydrogenase H-cluster radical SAM maturase HydE [Lentisphaeria bacterium]
MIEKIKQKALAGEGISREEILFVLSCSDRESLKEIFSAAYAVKLREVGRKVHLRGLVEISNICTKNCFYCGIRRGNSAVSRYALSQEEILECARLTQKFEYGSLVLQAGERCDAAFVDFIEDTLRKIKALPGFELGITLSLGEQSLETYKRWFAAGAHRYLLRIETSSEKLYRELHPADHLLSERKACLDRLRDAGYMVGTGVMSGLPGQTLESLADDIEFFRRQKVDMIGMGPYITHHATPLGEKYPDYPSDLSLGLKMIAATRLALRNVNIASTTALQTLAPDGREQGLLAGANVIMPNVGDLVHRKDYLLYENKPGTDENAADTRKNLERAIAAIGEEIEYNTWGDPTFFSAGKESRQRKGM